MARTLSRRRFVRTSTAGLAVASLSPVFSPVPSGQTRSGRTGVASKGNRSPAMMLRVRFKTALSFDQVNSVVEERAPEFESLAGLRQKYYLQDTVSGEYAGVYIWDTAEALAEYRKSELRASIAKAYETQGEPHIEVYRIIKVLREDRAGTA